MASPMLRPPLLLALLVAATLLQGVSAKKRNNGGSRMAATRKKECEQVTCADADPDDGELPRENCIQQCLSAECYQQVYAGNELEPLQLVCPPYLRIRDRWRLWMSHSSRRLPDRWWSSRLSMRRRDRK